MTRLRTNLFRVPVVAIVLASMFFITAADATGKLATESYSIWQVLWVRSWIWLLFALAWFGSFREIRASLGSRQAGFHILRSLVLVTEITVMIFSFKLLPLGDVTAIIAVTPLVVVGLSAVLLGERVDRIKLAAIGLGLLGVLLVARPGIGIFGFATLIPMGGMILWALYQIFQKKIGTIDDERTSLLWTALVMVAALSVVGPWVWVTPADLGDLSVMALAGLFNVLGHFGLMMALRRATASEIQPYSYTTVVWAIVLGLAMFGEIPDLFGSLGVAMILAAGVFGNRLPRRLGSKPTRREAEVTL